jgi:hypothetical protein
VGGSEGVVIMGEYEVGKLLKIQTIGKRQI